MFEYMGLGLPLIASDFPLYRNVVETEGTVIRVDPTDSEAVVTAILSLKENPETVAAVGARRKRAVAERYKWNGEEQRLLRFYESVLKAM
jgi:glycosyltransferase involved in cell wall biosynthesis